MSNGHFLRASRHACQQMIRMIMRRYLGLFTDLLAFALQLRNTPKTSARITSDEGCATNHRLKWRPLPPNELREVFHLSLIYISRTFPTGYKSNNGTIRTLGKNYLFPSKRRLLQTGWWNVNGFTTISHPKQNTHGTLRGNHNSMNQVYGWDILMCSQYDLKGMMNWNPS